MCHQRKAGHSQRVAVGLGILVCLVLAAPLRAQSTQPRATFQAHTESINSVTFSPDGKTLASGGYDGTIRLWDVGSGKEQATLKRVGAHNATESLAFSPDGKKLAAGGVGAIILLWDLSTHKETALSDEVQQNIGPLIVFSPDGKLLASGNKCGSNLKVFNVKTGKMRALPDDETNGGIAALAFTPDSKTLATIYEHDGLRLWDVATGKNTSTRKMDHHSCATISRDGKSVATMTGGDYGRDPVIGVWDVATIKNQATLKGHTEWVWCMAFSPDGKTLATGSEDKTIKLWDVLKGKEIATLTGHTDTVKALAYSPDGRLLASGSDDKTIKIWDVPKAK